MVSRGGGGGGGVLYMDGAILCGWSYIVGSSILWDVGGGLCMRVAKLYGWSYVVYCIVSIKL